MGFLLDLQPLMHEVVARVQVVDLILHALDVATRLYLLELEDRAVLTVLSASPVVVGLLGLRLGLLGLPPELLDVLEVRRALL